MNRHIDSIHIQDFQNHQDTHIKLVPGLNIITGSSDSGKSAIVRALDLAFLDTFRKQDVRDGQKNSHVTINFRNGDTFNMQEKKFKNTHDSLKSFLKKH